MKTTLTLEQIALFAAGCTVCYLQPYSLPWYLWLLLFLSPDISMVGYLVNNKIGAIFYNVAHHMGVAILFLLVGIIFQIAWMELAGGLLLAHAAFDRVMGYGLKYADSFHHTHLGMIGKKK